jgi:hypothetical protein
MRASNPKQVLDFDPKTQRLVTANAQTLVQGYAIPVAYQPEPNYTEGYLSYRLIPRGGCMVTRDSQSRIITFGMSFNQRLQKQVCVLRFPEMPEGKIVKAVRTGDDEIWRGKWGISEQTTTLSIDGKVIGSYRTASVWHLPLLPAGFIGCALIDSDSSWRCAAGFMRQHIVLDTVPPGVDRTKYDAPLSIMLGLKKYTEADLTNFHGYAVNEGALARVAQEPKRVEDDVFKVLAAILDGHNVKPTFNMGYSLAQNPERLAPLAEKMAARLVALDKEDVRRPNRQEQMRALATALASLPPPAFQSVAEQAFDVVQKDKGWDRFPALYVRAAAAGPQTLSLYESDLLYGNMPRFLHGLPALAICRIGRASDAAIATMKSQVANANLDEDYRSALFVALMKLGQEEFLRDSLSSMRPSLRPWAEAVLAHKGENAVGPNNCMGKRWGNTHYEGPMLQPSLQWQRGGWAARAP